MKSNPCRKCKNNICLLKECDIKKEWLGRKAKGDLEGNRTNPEVGGGYRAKKHFTPL